MRTVTALWIVGWGSAVGAKEIVVDFLDDVAPARVEAVARRLGLALAPASIDTERDRIYLARVPDLHSLAALEADPSIEAVEENSLYSIPDGEWGVLDATEVDRTRTFPNDPRYREQWHLEQIHLPAAWKLGQGKGVVVAVIDTGVSRVSDLQATEFVSGWNFVDNSDHAEDDHGHGTHVAGTIAQSTNNGVGVAGVAYRAKIMPLKVLSAQGSGSVAGIAAAVRWAADHGAKVINMSLGGPLASRVLGSAVKYAHDHGVVVVCAAGNDGKGKVSYPAAYPSAIAVAATQKDEATTFYSNWGKQIDIAAPGGNVRSEPTGGVLQNTFFQGRDDYFFFMGTSMASPHIAGVAALVMSAGVTDPDAVEKLLKTSARRPAGMKDEPGDYALHYGAGIVDAAAALKRAKVGGGALEIGAASAIALAMAARLRRRMVRFGGLGAAVLVVGALFPAWDQSLLGVTGHGNLLFYSALLPMLALILFYGVPRARIGLAALAWGVAGHLAAQLVWRTVDIQWMAWDSVWLAANALLASAIGYAAARK